MLFLDRGVPKHRVGTGQLDYELIRGTLGTIMCDAGSSMAVQHS